LKHKLFSSLAAAKAAIPLYKARLLVLDGHRICLAHTAAGLFAVEDTCPHLGESLSKGTTNYLNEIVCPWHSYRFNLSTGAECKYRTHNLKTFVIHQEEDGIYIEI
jgi:nitrite reductase/ring-hydroxylating ferredoxin subunit